MKKETSVREVLDRSQNFLPYDPSFKWSADAVNELQQSCGRFKSLLSFEEKVRAKMFNYINQIAFFKERTVVWSPGIPSNWQRLLDYLYKNGVINSPQFYNKKFM